VVFRIELTPAAGKALDKLAKSNRSLLKKIDRAILDLAENPTPANCKKLAGETPPMFRFRVGDYRILYLIEEEVLVILVVNIGHRKDVYRFLKR
jgi:mRNA interferase RelE/StbE